MESNSTNMRITIGLPNHQDFEKLLALLKGLGIKNMEVVPGPSGGQPTITRGDKSMDPSALFGIWKDDPRDLDNLQTI